jgi:hypothetical protein
MQNRALLTQMHERLCPHFETPSNLEILQEVEYWRKAKPSQNVDMSAGEIERTAHDWLADLNKYPMAIIRYAWNLYRVENKFAPNVGDMNKYIERALQETRFWYFRSMAAKIGYALKAIDEGRIEVARQRITPQEADQIRRLRIVK